MVRGRLAVMGEPATRRGRTRTHQQTPGVRALDRGLAVLEALGQHGETSLSELARQTDLSCSTVYRLLETLRQRGYAGQDGSSGLYRMGPKALQLGGACAATKSLPQAAHPAMEQLVATINETANLAVLAGKQAVYIHQVEAKQSIRMFTELGAQVPLHCTGVGKVLLAWRAEEVVLELLGGGRLARFTPATITRPTAFLKELARVRSCGYAVDDEERETGVRCVTAPVRDDSGEVIAALSVSAPATRLPKKQIAQRGRQVAAAADEASRQLGFHGP